VIVTCPGCSASYHYDDARFGERERKKLKCARCGFVFEMKRPAPEAENNAAGPAQAAAAEPATEVSPPRSEAAAAPAELPPLPSNRRYSLAILLGADAGNIRPMTQPRVVLGRGGESDVQLHDSEVSRRHAMIEVRGDDITLTDLGSTNGTFVGGEPVQTTALANRQEFVLGATSIMLIVTDALAEDTHQG
jgi:predicted Zn finger-like uncharacterized protein